MGDDDTALYQAQLTHAIVDPQLTITLSRLHRSVTAELIVLTQLRSEANPTRVRARTKGTAGR